MLRSELPGLASSSFEPIGHFGVGFFSIFMLGSRVVVSTRRFKKLDDDESDQWVLEFENGLDDRPILRRPVSTETLPRSGTRVSVALTNEILGKLHGSLFKLDFCPSNWFERQFLGEQTLRFRNDGKIDSSDLRYIVVSLCPSLEMTVFVRVNLQPSELVLRSEDWMTLNPLYLLLRLDPIYRRPDFFVPNLLIDLMDTSGGLLGRIAYAGSNHSAVITHRGLRCGSVPGLMGLVLGDNNQDLVRNESRPVGSKEAWCEWAKKSISSSKHQDLEMLISLHALCPEEDLAVYRVGTKQLDESELLEWIEGRSEIYMIEGFPNHAERDDIAACRFDQDFRVLEDLLILPIPVNQLSDSLRFPQIRYMERLDHFFAKVWGEFEEWSEEDALVGHVDPIEITRELNLYARKSVDRTS